MGPQTCACASEWLSERESLLVVQQQTGVPGQFNRPAVCHWPYDTIFVCQQKPFFFTTWEAKTFCIWHFRTKCISLITIIHPECPANSLKCHPETVFIFSRWFFIRCNCWRSLFLFYVGVGRMDDTHIIRYGTRDGESSTRKASNTQCAPRTGNSIYLPVIKRSQNYCRAGQYWQNKHWNIQGYIQYGANP